MIRDKEQKSRETSGQLKGGKKAKLPTPADILMDI